VVLFEFFLEKQGLDSECKIEPRFVVRVEGVPRRFRSILLSVQQVDAQTAPAVHMNPVRDLFFSHQSEPDGNVFDFGLG